MNFFSLKGLFNNYVGQLFIFACEIEKKVVSLHFGYQP